MDNGGAAQANSPSSETPSLTRRVANGSADATGSLITAVKDRNVFDHNDSTIKSEIIQVIVQYLQDEGYVTSSLIVQDEANLKVKNTSNKRSQLRRIRRAVMNGDWIEVENILGQKGTGFRHQSQFLYAVYKQQYLEFIDSQNYQKALAILSKKLKPLERYAYTKSEFRDLCYLLTCQSVTECDQFADWDGANASRIALVDQCARLLDFETFQSESSTCSATLIRGISQANASAPGGLPPGRLVNLIQQALAFQVDSSMYKLPAPPKIGTILEDFECFVVPNRLKNKLIGHRGNVKCVAFVGEEGRALVTGSSDNLGRIWSSESGVCLAVLKGHRSRIWDVCANDAGSLVATGGADGTVRLWDLRKVLDSLTGSRIVDGSGFEVADQCENLLRETENVMSSHLSLQATACTSIAAMGDIGGADIYTVRFHPNGRLLVAGGYDNELRVYDAESQELLHCFPGHESSISCIAFNGRGTLVLSGSKDATVRYWDVVSGLCVNTLSGHLGEVTSLNTDSSGTLLLTSSKDNSNRLWDVRQCKPIRRFKGHQNTSKNFIRSEFGPKDRLIVGGSEDGYVYMWDVDTEEVVGTLGPANGPVYSAVWNARKGLLASCSHDGLGYTWCYDPK